MMMMMNMIMRMNMTMMVNMMMMMTVWRMLTLDHSGTQRHFPEWPHPTHLGLIILMTMVTITDDHGQHHLDDHGHHH